MRLQIPSSIPSLRSSLPLFWSWLKKFFTMSTSIPELGLLADQPTTTCTTNVIASLLTGLYCNPDCPSWEDCVISEAVGYKNDEDLSLHESVILTVRRGVTTFYVQLERTWGTGKRSDDSAQAGNSSRLAKSSNASKVSISKPVRANDGVTVHRAAPSTTEKSITYRLTFHSAIPYMIGALAAESITLQCPNYKLLDTNCYFFAGLLCRLLEKYAKDEHIDFTKGDEEDRERERDRERGRMWGQEQQGKNMKTSTGGTFHGYPIIDEEYFQEMLVKTYPTLQTQIIKFRQMVRHHVLF